MFGPYVSFVVMLFLCTGAVLLVGHMSARERRLRATDRGSAMFETSKPSRRSS